MTTFDDESDAEILWRFERDTPVLEWNCDQLEAVNLLFHGIDLVPRLSPFEFGSSFRLHMAYHTDGLGRLSPEARGVLEAMLAPWRDEINALQAEIDAMPEGEPEPEDEP